jgi:hypothetical protein
VIATTQKPSVGTIQPTRSETSAPTAAQTPIRSPSDLLFMTTEPTSAPITGAPISQEPLAAPATTAPTPRPTSMPSTQAPTSRPTKHPTNHPTVAATTKVPTRNANRPETQLTCPQPNFRPKSQPASLRIFRRCIQLPVRQKSLQ